MYHTTPSTPNLTNTVDKDKGSFQNIDMKTPQQRPKLKPRNTINTATPASSEKSMTPKKKYVRRKNVGTEAETPKEGLIQNDLGSKVKTTPKRNYTSVKKVVIDGTKPASSEKINTPKRKYARKKNVGNEAKTPKEDQTKGKELNAPNLTNTADKAKGLREENYQVGVEAIENKDSALNKIPIESSELQKENQPELVVDISNVSKTPKQRPRKKKHRPKVVIDGKPKRKPRNTTTTPASSEKTNTSKRKYVRRKNVGTEGETPEEGIVLQSDLGSEVKTTAMRKYTRIKKVNETTMTPPEEVVSQSDLVFEVKTTAKRKYTKVKKVIEPTMTPPEEVVSHSDLGFEVKTTEKRKYTRVRKVNKVNEPTMTPPEEVASQSDSDFEVKKTLKKKYMTPPEGGVSIPKRSRKRSLNFDLDSQIACEKSTSQIPLTENQISSPLKPEGKVHGAQVKQTSSEWIQPIRNAEQITMEQSNGLHHTYQLSCFTPRTKLQCIPRVVDIIKQFKRLDISTKRNARTSLKKIALISDPYRYSGNNDLVVYQGDQSMIPYVGSSNRSKIRGPRPKVDLDEESAREGTLLLENIDNQGIDGKDEEQFGEIVNSFVVKMRLLQGDRRFRPWKGSVLDSVIGVFLTQNVSDHHSSSAFMSMASKYPPEPKSDHASSSEGISEIHDLCHLEDIAGDVFSLNNYPKLIRNLSECGQTSVVSPQNSTYSIGNKKDLSSDTFMEEESTSQNTSFVEHLQMQEQRVNDSQLERNAYQSGLSKESGAEPSSQNSIGICSEQTMQNHENLESKNVKLDAYNYETSFETTNGVNPVKRKTTKHGKIVKGPEPEVDWDSFRIQAEAKGKRERSSDTTDSVDWERVRCAAVSDIADTIIERGMNNRLAERIKGFLNRLVREHGSLDLEWLRDIPPDKAKEYLLSVMGLGLKSTECVRLLTLHHLAFPVDTNVARIAVRLGWVPLQPLPESIQLHLLKMYPVMESIQKYLWPRLCKLDQRQLYELHYHMITFGKVFCTKISPNCNSCPMRVDCKHFSSANASARLGLPAPQDKDHGNYAKNVDLLQLPGPQSTENFGPASLLQFSLPAFLASETAKPIIEEPTTPQISDSETDTAKETLTETQWTPSMPDMEDIFTESDDEIPSFDINLEALNWNLEDRAFSSAIIVTTPEAAWNPKPKLKTIIHLRTEHQVYMLPDSHQLLKGLEKREEEDPSPYLLAIWASGETINSIQPPERKCSSEGSGQLCSDDTCFPCNSIRESASDIVRGTILIPCRTAMRGRFPLNGTYFQVNEVFADHETSLKPIKIPREWLWNLDRRIVYFGTSISSIFKGLRDTEIMKCFQKGFVCVRGFDRKTRGPRKLISRLHFSKSKRADKVAS